MRPRVKAHQPYHGVNLPQYVDARLWEVFIAQRHVGKRAEKFSQNAAELLLEDLIRFKCLGYDPNLSLRKSIERGYDGVFPVEQQQIQPTAQASYENQQRRQREEAERQKREALSPQAREAKERALASARAAIRRVA